MPELTAKPRRHEDDDARKTRKSDPVATPERVTLNTLGAHCREWLAPAVGWSGTLEEQLGAGPTLLVSAQISCDGLSEPIDAAGPEGVGVDTVNVPKAVRPYADQIVAATDAVCLEHLDREYADLSRRLVGKLGRKRPCPLTRGDLGIWAAGVVYAVGQLNFVFDPAQTPHASADQLSVWFGVKKTTMANKARLIRDTLALTHFDSEFTRRDLAQANPLTWVVEVDGLLVDIRHVPVHLQVQAFELGLIPFVPGVAGDGT